MDILGTKGVAAYFCKSAQFPQCFDDLIFIDSIIFTFNKSLNLHLIKLALLKACHGSQACILFYTIHELYMNTRKAFFIITVKSNLSVKIIVFTQPGQHVCVLIKSYSGYLLLIKLFSF